MTPARIRHALAVVAAVLTVAPAVVPTAATADDLPRNGRISFGRFDPALGDYSIWTADADGNRQRRLTQVPSYFSDWSPDGRRIAFDFADGTGVHIATADPDGRNVRRLTTGPGIQEAPDWSPDGRWITFNASSLLPGQPGFATDIWIMRADGSGARRLTRGGFDVEPVFSPDGGRIAFARITRDADVADEALYVMRTDGTGLRRVVPPTSGLEHPEWAPDGRLLFNVSPFAPGAAIMSVRSDGSGLRVVRHSDSRFELFKPASSPDGRKLLLGCFDVRAQIDRICSMTTDGHRLSVVVAATDPVNFPAWGAR